MFSVTTKPSPSLPPPLEMLWLTIPIDLALHVEHRPAGVAGIDRGVGLEELGERHGLVHRIGRPARADISHAQRVAQAVRRPHDDDLVAHVHRAGVGHRGHLRARRHPVELQQGQIGRRLGGHHARRHRVAPDELHRDLVHGVHHVRRRHHLAVRRDEDAGAGLGKARLPRGRHVPAAGADHRDRRRHLLEHLPDGLGARGHGAHASAETNSAASESPRPGRIADTIVIMGRLHGLAVIACAIAIIARAVEAES